MLISDLEETRTASNLRLLVMSALKVKVVLEVDSLRRGFLSLLVMLDLLRLTRAGTSVQRFFWSEAIVAELLA
jgi:hypothetical protein